MLRKHVPTYTDTVGKVVWTGPHEVIDVCNTNHTVRLWLKAAGRPSKIGHNLGLEWTHTSNVKPCCLDKEGRLLLVRVLPRMEEYEKLPNNDDLKCHLNMVELGRDRSVQTPQEVENEDDLINHQIYACLNDIPENEFQVMTTRSMAEYNSFLDASQWSSLINPNNFGPKLPDGVLDICDEIMGEELIVRLDCSDDLNSFFFDKELGEESIGPSGPSNNPSDNPSDNPRDISKDDSD